MRELTISRYTSTRRKPGPTAKARAKRRRAEYPVAKAVRAACVERDGYCRFKAFGDCAGPSEWMHLGEKKRARTRGMRPEQRHTIEGSAMGCAFHHALYDSGEMILTMTADGANGPIVARYRQYLTECL